MAITVEQAIEILKKRVGSPFVRANADTVDATKLGIAALELVRRENLEPMLRLREMEDERTKLHNHGIDYKQE